jgi:hypothetical protein
MAKTAKTSAKKKAPKDKAFMDNLSKAIKDEYHKASGRPAPAEARPTAEPKTVKAEAKTPARKAPSPAKPKGATATKASAKATSAASTAAAAATEAAERERLLRELKSLLGKLDVEGLSFLLEQAHVHLYNMEADRINAFREAREEKEGSEGGAAPNAKIRVDRSESGSSYYIASGSAYPMFTGPEMLALVRLAHGNEDEGDAARALIKWMGRERGDALNELGGGDLGLFTELARTLRKSFRAPAAKD